MSTEVDKKADQILEAIDLASRSLSIDEWRELLLRIAAGCNERAGQYEE